MFRQRRVIFSRFVTKNLIDVRCLHVWMVDEDGSTFSNRVASGAVLNELQTGVISISGRSVDLYGDASRMG